MLMIASTPTFFMLLSYSSSYRDLPAECRVTQALFAGAYLFFTPCLFAMCMKMGSACRSYETGTEDQKTFVNGVLSTLRYCAIAVACTVVNAFFNVVPCPIPWKISARAGSFKSLKPEQQWIGPLMSGTMLVVCGLVAHCVFKRITAVPAKSKNQVRV